MFVNGNGTGTWVLASAATRGPSACRARKILAISASTPATGGDLYGFSSLNLLNCHEDPSFLRGDAPRLHRAAVLACAAGQRGPARRQWRGLGALRQRAAVRQGLPRGRIRHRRACVGRPRPIPAAAPDSPISARSGHPTSRPTNSRPRSRTSTRPGTASSPSAARSTRPPKPELKTRLPKLLDVNAALWFLAMTPRRSTATAMRAARATS